MLRWIAFAPVVLIAFVWAEAQEVQLLPREEFRDWAVANGSRLDTVEPRDNQTDLAPLKRLVGNARVVALGEAVHGAHEEMGLRNRMIRYLITEHGFTAVALEAGLTQSKLLHDYVLGRVEATEAEISAAFSYGFGGFQENHDLVHWLREQNSSLPHERRVRLYGFDLAGSYFDNAHRSLDAVLAYVDRADPSAAPSIRDDYRATLAGVDTSAYLQLPQVEQDRVAAKLADLVALLYRNRVAYVAATSRDDYEWALRQAVVAVQDCCFQRTLPHDFSMGKTKREGYVGWDTAMNQRDATMAENVEWVLAREGTKGRVFLYAHNYHVQAGEQEKAPRSSERRESLRGGFPLGTHLRSMLGTDLVVIGSQCGAFQGWPANAGRGLSESSVGSFKDLAGSPGMPLYLVDFRRLPDSGPLRQWMSEVQAEGIFQDRRLVPAQAYDGLIYHGVLTPATAFKSPK